MSFFDNLFKNRSNENNNSGENLTDYQKLESEVDADLRSRNINFTYIPNLMIGKSTNQN